ncbi:Gfo/Idh/MocA family protein [Flexithrix dorotheae]|uniref:Gfo/Idh/MocA family protein n=1 Tax=Flexithrix dorotheae TaxID=70993 RepID=UPI00035F0177|nr:Gfo/Idh/MocA family oxidoreductase [Flexithrix dorotheae]
MKNSRRKFLTTSSTMLAGAGMIAGNPLPTFYYPSGKISANDQINIGVIGCKGMGWSNMRAHLAMEEVNCVALCDVDQSVLDQRANDVEKMRGTKPKLYKDYRKLLEDKDIDAVIVGTPDHWHCLITVAACEAGKDVYVEKPLANSVEECNIMVAAAKKYNRIVQVGQWQRSGRHYDQAIQFVQSGKLGQIRLVKVWAYQGWMKPIANAADSEVPAGVDYKMWLGPAPTRPFNKNRFHFNFRWFWDYAGGLMTDWGVHEIDIALYAMKAKAPKSVMASGGKFAYPDDPSETPDTLQAVFEYENFNMLWEHAVGIDGGNYGRTEGIAFIGNNGTLVVNRGGWEVIPEVENKDRKDYFYKMEAIPNQPKTGNPLEEHTQNFVEAMKSRKKEDLKCWIETGSVAAINAHMGNISYRTGRKIYWDQSKGLFLNDDEANEMLKPTYHNNWELPNI